MARSGSVLQRLICIILASVFLCQELACSAPPSEGFAILGSSRSFDLSQDPTRFEAPINFSSLREVHKGQSDKPFIIHIQDAHSNLSGQENLASTLDEIMTKYKVSLVLVEGGGTDGTLDPLKKLASPQIIKRTAKKLLIEGKLAGEEYLNLTSDHPMKIMGIEDMALYRKSVENYAKLADKRDAILDYINLMKRSVQKLKNKLYPQEILACEKAKKSKDDSSFEFNFKGLFDLAQAKNIDFKDFPNIQKLKALQDQERDIDFNLANLEQASLIEEIEKQDGGENLRDYLKIATQLKNQRVSQFAFFQKIFEISKEKNISLSKYPNLLRYSEYLRSFSDLDLDKILDELTRLEDKTYVAWLPEPNQRLTRSIDRYLALLNIAYQIQMSTKDFEFFRANEPDFSTASYQAFLNRKLIELGYFEDVIPYKNILEEGKKSLEDFYDSVSQRDVAFIRNSERMLKEERQQVAVLISGGYHTTHLKKLFKDKDYSYAVLTPIVTSETNQQKYEKLLLSEVRKEIKNVEVVQGKTRDRPLSQLDTDFLKSIRKKEGVRLAGSIATTARLAGTVNAFADGAGLDLGNRNVRQIQEELTKRLTSAPASTTPKTDGARLAVLYEGNEIAEEERYMNEQMIYVQRYLLKKRVYSKNHPAVKYLHELLSLILRGTHAEVMLVQDEKPRAFAAPSGHIVITTSAAREFMTSRESALALLMHELRHLEKKHSYKRYLHPPDLVDEIGQTRLNEFEADFAMMDELDKRGQNPVGALHLARNIEKYVQREIEEKIRKDPEMADYYRKVGDVDLTHGAPTQRKMNLREMVRFFDFKNLADEAHPIAWDALKMDETNDTAEDFWLDFGHFYDASRSEEWRARVSQWVRERGLTVSGEEEAALLMILGHFILEEKTEPKPALTMPVLTRLLNKKAFDTLGLPLSPDELLALSEEAIENSFKSLRTGDAEEIFSQALRLKEEVFGLFDRHFAGAVDFKRSWHTALLSRFIFYRWASGAVPPTSIILTKTLVKAEDSSTKLKTFTVELNQKIPFEEPDEQSLRKLVNEFRMDSANLDAAAYFIQDRLGIGPYFNFEHTDPYTFYYLNVENMPDIKGFQKKIQLAFNFLLKEMDKQSLGQTKNLIKRYDQYVSYVAEGFVSLSDDENAPGAGNLEGLKLDRVMRNFVLIDSYGDRFNLLKEGRQKAMAIAKKIVRLSPDQFRREVEKAILSKTYDTRGLARFRSLIKEIRFRHEQFLYVRRLEGKAGNLPAHSEEKSQPGQGVDLYSRQALERELLYDSYLAMDKTAFLSEANRTISFYRRELTVKDARDLTRWIAEIWNERERLLAGARLSQSQEGFAAGDLARLPSLLTRVKQREVSRLSRMAGAEVFDSARSVIDEWPIAFTRMDHASYETKWRDISMQATNYFQSHPDFPNTASDFEKVLSLALLSQESFSVYSVVSTAFREMILRSQDFEEAFGYVKKYGFLPRVLVQEAADVLTERYAKSPAQLEAVNAWVREQIETEMKAAGKAFAMEIGQVLSRFVSAGEGLEFLKAILSTYESDEDFKKYMAKKWWYSFHLFKFSNIGNITHRGYYGELNGNAELLQAAHYDAAQPVERGVLDETVFFEEFYSSLFRMDSVVLYLVLRAIALEGQGAVFQDKKSKENLVDYVVERYLRFEPSSEAQKLVQNLRASIAEDLEPEDIFYFLGPSMAALSLQLPLHPYPTEKIVDFLLEEYLKSIKTKYPGIEDSEKFPETHRILKMRIRAFVSGVMPELTRKPGEAGDLVALEKISRFTVFEDAALERLAPYITARRVFSDKVTPVELAVEVAKRVGGLAVRLLQLAAMYFRLSPADREKVSQVFDAVRGQNKLQAYLVMKREAEGNPRFRAIFESIREIQEMIGGGSIVTVFPVKDASGERWAAGVKNPNAEYRSSELSRFASQILDGLIRRDPENKYFRMIKLLLDDAYQWILDEIRDPEYFEKNDRFKALNDSSSPSSQKFEPGGPLGILIPDILDTGTDWVRWEKFVEGKSLNELLVDYQKAKDQGDLASSHSLGVLVKNAVALIGKNYVFQLLKTGLVHPDLHPGQFIISEGNLMAVLDRKNLLRFDASEVKVLNSTVHNISFGLYEQAFSEIFRFFAGPNADALADLGDQIKKDFSQFSPGHPEDSINQALWRLKERGVSVPIKWILAIKNLFALNRMSQLADFQSVQEMLFYSPQPLTAAPVSPADAARLALEPAPKSSSLMVKVGDIERLNEIFQVSVPSQSLSNLQEVDNESVRLLARWYVTKGNTADLTSFEIRTKNALIQIAPQAGNPKAAEILFYHPDEVALEKASEPFGRIPLSEQMLDEARQTNRQTQEISVERVQSVEAEVLAAAVRTNSMNREAVRALMDQILSVLSENKQVVISQAIDQKRIAEDPIAKAEYELIQATISSVRKLLGDKKDFVHFEFTNPNGEPDTGLSEDTSGLKQYERIYVAQPNPAILQKALNQAGFLALPDPTKEQGLIPFQAAYLAAIMVSTSEQMDESLARVLNTLIRRESAMKLTQKDFKDIKKVTRVNEQRYLDLAIKIVPVNLQAVLQAARLAIQSVGVAA